MKHNHVPLGKKSLLGVRGWLQLAARAAGFAACFASVLLMPQPCARGVCRGLELCASAVIPSMFMLMLAAILLVESGLAQLIGIYLSPATERLFGLPGAVGTAALLAVTGGYPAGAKAVRALYDKGAISSAEAKQASLFCFCAGPAFLLGTVGTGLLGSVRAGVLLLAVQLTALPLLGVAVDLIINGGKRSMPTQKKNKRQAAQLLPISQAIIPAASQTASAMLSVCLYVVIFCAIGEMLRSSGANGAVSRLLQLIGFSDRLADASITIILEVTSGCVAAQQLGLPAIAFCVGFGGLSTHMQAYAILGRECVQRGHFLAARAAQGLLSALLCSIALKLLPSDAVAAFALTATPALSGSVTGAATLALMCLMCLLCLPPEAADRYNTDIR